MAALAAGCGDDEEPGTAATVPRNTAEVQPPAQPQTTTGAPAPPADSTPERVPPIPRGTLGQGSKPDPELFFLFEDEKDARAAAADLNDHGYRVRTTPPAPDVPDWSVIAEGTPAGSLAEAEDALRAWAKARGGRYDGNERPVGP